MIEPVIEESNEISKPSLPYAKTIAWLAILGLAACLVDLIWGYITIIPGFILIILAWWLLVKAKRMYYGFPYKYSEESNLILDQSRLVLIAASIVAFMLLMRVLVVYIGGMTYS